MSNLPDNVSRLVDALAGIEDLEILLLLARSPERSWSARAIASALHVRRDITPALERLARINLVDVKLAHEILYRYAVTTTTPELARSVTDLDREYALRRLSILERLGSRRAIREFADAFRVRRRRKT